jgi:hypothetical protein
LARLPACESRARRTVEPPGACAREGDGRRDPPAADGERVPEKAAAFRQDGSVAERCALIGAEKANYPITFVCELLAVPRSSFYAWRNRVETATRARRRVLAVQVQRMFDDSRQTFGCRRLAAQLNREGA